jgi:3-hydroxyacyl-CoA dehydrogenase
LVPTDLVIEAATEREQIQAGDFRGSAATSHAGQHDSDVQYIIVSIRIASPYGPARENSGFHFMNPVPISWLN